MEHVGIMIGSMTKEKRYTIGEIFRGEMLLNSNGKPYTAKPSVAKVLSRYPHKAKKTPWGDAKTYGDEIINELNSRWDD